MKLEDNLKGVVTRIGQEFKTTNAQVAKKADKSDVYTKQETDKAISDKITNVYRYKGSVTSYDKLPKTGNTVGDVYNVESTGANYAWVGGTGGELKDGWDSIGGTVDLTGYLTKAVADTTYEKIFAKNSAFNKNYGTTANTTAQGNDSRFHTHTNKAVLDASTASFTTELKTKLDGVAAGANNYVHPTSAGNKHIPAGGTVGQYIRNSATGTGIWATISDSEIECADDLVAVFENTLK